MSDPTGRAELRGVLLSILETVPGVKTVMCPGDWNVVSANTPAIKLRHGKEEKKSIGNVGQTAFTTTAAFEIVVEITAKSGPAAQLLLDSLTSDIEAAIFKSIPLRNLAQDFPACHTTTEISAEGGPHTGVASILLAVEFYEAFAPDINTELLGVNVTADLTNVADPGGTYPNPPFPSAVKPAPRTEGPDGRAEGTVNVQFSQ
ncbi:hypothetical protein NK8_12800 [Caballeronia sp. NK8]|uniref:hypothetical protein n=1 Tax=Caballeronia sp. NK8 TaxID=140098 RepID=UPI001BB51748|nr:hypothetical protein [Caballeronia sp. NK8]BCQ23155.1 hypothetical protein NK8_12800 [Caballeronia sp. NK8]